MKILHKGVYVNTEAGLMKGFVLIRKLDFFGPTPVVIVYSKARGKHKQFDTFNLSEKEIMRFKEDVGVKDFSYFPQCSFLKKTLFKKVVDETDKIQQDGNIMDEIQKEIDKV